MSEQKASKLVVVAGATGYLGGHVVRTLHDAGFRVRALARDPARLEKVRDAADEVFVGEATQPESLADLCDGAFAVFSSIGVRHIHRHPNIWEVDEQANVNLVEAAEKAGVERFIFVSVLHGDDLRGQVAVAEARERVVDRLEASPMKSTVLRPSGFFNDMGEIFEMARSGRVWVVGDGTARVNPIHGADIGAEVVATLHSKSPPASLPLGGPDVLTMDGIAELAFSILGTEPKISHVPAGLLRGASTLTKPFNTNLSAFLRMFAVMEGDMAVAPSHGTHHLADHFRGLAGDSDLKRSSPNRP